MCVQTVEIKDYHTDGHIFIKEVIDLMYVCCSQWHVSWLTKFQTKI